MHLTLLGLGRDTWAYGLRLLPIHFLLFFFFWASLANIPTGPAHFSTSLPLLGFIRPHSYYASPFHSLGFLSTFHSSGFLSPFHSSGFLGPFSSSSFFYLFYPYGLLLNPLGFPNPITMSLPHYLSGLLAFLPSL